MSKRPDNTSAASDVWPHTELSPQELQNVAQREGITFEELKKSEDFDPHLNLKVVLVEEAGQLKIGYFEFLLPSMMD